MKKSHRLFRLIMSLDGWLLRLLSSPGMHQHLNLFLSIKEE
jgi:hypothetical protein